MTHRKTAPRLMPAPAAKAHLGRRLAAVLVLLLGLGIGWILFGPNGESKNDPLGKDFTNSISMKFVRVGKGTFWMGSPPRRGRARTKTGRAKKGDDRR